MFISIKFTETSVDQTTKIHQEVIGLKFYVQNIHTNTQTYALKRLQYAAAAAISTVR